MTWIPCSNGNVPPGAISTGYTSTGEALYIGRAIHNGNFTPGKVHPSHRVLYVPFNGGEHRHTQYEVLVGMQQQNNWQYATVQQAPVQMGAFHSPLPRGGTYQAGFITPPNQESAIRSVKLNFAWGANAQQQPIRQPYEVCRSIVCLL